MSRLIALVGPTAVGKTDISIELAKWLDAEIIGCDSMQVYRRMRRLTTQPTDEERATVPHHLIDCVEPTETFSVGRYRTEALAAMADIQRRGRAVLLVGGTGLYLKALMRGLSDVPAGDGRVRETFAAAIREEGSAEWHARLRRIDAPAAAKIHPNDARRIVRALEVYELTGKPLSSFWKWEQEPVLPMTAIGLTRERAELHTRINQRVERMIRDEAVLEEVRRLQHVPLNRTALQVHGLRFVRACLSGEMTREQAIAQWQQQVRQYARRQLIWFRAEPRVQWLTLAADESLEGTVRRILAAVS